MIVVRNRCKHPYLVVESEVRGSGNGWIGKGFYTILQWCTAIFTLCVGCIGVVINALQRHFTLFYTFTGESVKTGVKTGLLFFIFIIILYVQYCIYTIYRGHK